MAQSIYRPGTPVWLVDREQGWLPGEVKSFSTTDSGLPVVQVKDEDGQVGRAARVALRDARANLECRKSF